jgi:hypothetical protein
MSKEIKLADLLSHISDQLMEADERSRKSGKATMQFEECEIEFAAKIEGNAEAGVNISVLKLGGGIKKSDSNTIRIKFKSLVGNTLQAAQFGQDKPGPELKRQVQKKK